MRVAIAIILTCWIGWSCNRQPHKVDLRGSWYYDFGDWGPIDTTINYAELYFGDSGFYAQDEVIGQARNRLYSVTADSIYFGDDSIDLRPFYKIIKLERDTLWLKANPTILKKRDTVFYVRLPKNEYGYYDLAWTPANKDSLREKVVIDFNRRMWKYHAFKSGGLRKFDSLEKAGYWHWTMKEIRETEQKEKDYQKKEE